MLDASDPRVRIHKTAFVIYTHADPFAAQNFLADFGLNVKETRGNDIFYSGYGPEPFCYWFKNGPTKGFGGAAYAVESREELDKASKVPGASPVRPLDAPGGGEWVSIKDPAGFHVHFVFGQEESTSTARPDFPSSSHAVNYEDADAKPRKGTFLRLNKGKQMAALAPHVLIACTGPAPVYKWGHYGFTYQSGKHDEVYDFYTRYFALAPSDQLHKDGQTIVTFFRPSTHAM